MDHIGLAVNSQSRECALPRDSQGENAYCLTQECSPERAAIVLAAVKDLVARGAILDCRCARWPLMSSYGRYAECHRPATDRVDTRRACRACAQLVPAFADHFRFSAVEEDSARH